MKEEKRTNHPSYGLLQINRVSSSPGKLLFDSAMRHQHFVELRICEAEVIDNGWTSHNYDKQRIIEIAMSESQFAHAICSLNNGVGTPCTLEYIHGRGQIDGPPLNDLRGKHTKGFKDKLANVVEAVQTVEKQLAERVENKHRMTLTEMREMLTELHRAVGNFAGNMAFAHQLFEEKMEDVVSRAKTEIEAHASAVIRNVGISTIAEHLPTLPTLQIGPPQMIETNDEQNRTQA